LALAEGFNEELDAWQEAFGVPVSTLLDNGLQ